MSNISIKSSSKLSINNEPAKIHPSPQVHAMIVAAGRGSRFASAIPKQYLLINEQTLLQLSVARLATSAYINNCLLVIAAADTTAQTLDFALPVSYTQGGVERWQSVSLGVQAITQSGAADDDLVLIHDAARPTVPTADIEQVIEAAMSEPYGAILAAPVADTLKQAQLKPFDHQVVSLPKLDTIAETNSADTTNGELYHYSKLTIDRGTIWQAQTPQVFRLGALRQALTFIAMQNLEITDEASAFEQLGLPIRLVTGSRQNIKLTYPDDALLITALIAAQQSPN